MNIDIATLSEAIAQSNAPGFDWVNFWGNMGGNIIAGIITGYLVTNYYRKKDDIREYSEKCFRICGIAMNLSTIIDNAIAQNTALGYSSLNEKILELNYLVRIPTSKYIKDEFVHQNVSKMREAICEASLAATILKGRIEIREKKDSFYYQNKSYHEDIITKNFDILEGDSKKYLIWELS